MVTRKKMKLLKDGIETVREWYSFVDKRTNVDARINKKLSTAKSEIEITQTEAQIVMRWYLLVPDVTKGKIDNVIFMALEHFIKQDKE